MTAKRFSALCADGPINPIGPYKSKGPKRKKARAGTHKDTAKLPPFANGAQDGAPTKAKAKATATAKRAAERCPIMATEQKTKCPPEGGRYKTETDSALRADGRTTVRPYKSNAKKTPERRQPDKFNRALQRQRPQKEKASRRDPQGRRKIPTLRQRRSGWGTHQSKGQSNGDDKAGGVKPTLQRQRRNPHPSPKTLSSCVRASRMGHP